MFNSNSETSSNYKKIDITLGNSEEAAPFLGSNRQSYFSHNDFADSYPNTYVISSQNDQNSWEVNIQKPSEEGLMSFLCVLNVCENEKDGHT